MIAVTKPTLLNLNIYDTTQKIGRTTKAVGKSMYYSVKNATAEDVKEFTMKAGTNIAAGALTKAFVCAALAGTAPTVVTVGATALAVGAVSTKITHWRDCKKAIANNQPPPEFNWKNYGLKGLFSSAMVGFGAFFSEQILNLFTPSGASAQTLPVGDLNLEGAQAVIEPAQPAAPVVAEIIQPQEPVIEIIIPAAPEPLIVPAAEIVTPSENVIIPSAIEPTVIESAPVLVEPQIIAETLPAVDVQSAAPVLTPVEDLEIEALQAVDIPAQPAPSLDVVPEIITEVQEPAPVIMSELPEMPALNIQVEALQPAAIVPAEEIVPQAIIAQPQELVQPDMPQDVVPEIIEPEPLTAVEELQAMDLTERGEYALEAHINGNAQGTADLGYFYFHGEQGLPQDYERAVEFYRDAAEQGNRLAIRDLSYVEIRAEQALSISAADTPVPEVLVPEVDVNLESYADITPEEVVQPLTAVEQLQAMDLGSKAQNALEGHINGDAQSTADLGYYYFHGQQGIPQDYEKAVEFYREAAAEGNRFAIRDLAYIEMQAERALGYAVPDITPTAEAVEAVADVAAPITSVEELQSLDLRARAENALEAHLSGDAQGTADLGYYYFHGYQGVPQDLEKAVEFYREAALEGNGYAIRDLGFVEQEAIKAGITLSDFELPEHLYERSAPAINTVSASPSESVRSGLRASCAGDLKAINGSRPQLQFECSVRGNHAYIYPGEHVRVSLPNGATHTFNLDAGAGRQSVNDFLQNSVLPEATSQFAMN